MGPTKLAVILIGALFVTFMVLDWYSILTLGVVNPHTFWLKYCVTLICVVLAWKAHGQTGNHRDARLLRNAFSFIGLADFFLVVLGGLIDNSSVKPVLLAVGVAFFAMVQIFLIIRHLAAIRAVHLPKSSISVVILSVIIALLLYTPAVAAAVVLREHLIAMGWFTMMGLIYIFLLLTSVWVGWAAKLYGAYAPDASMMIAIGMTLFLFCDICVSGQMFITGWPAAVANGLVWLFYAPALVLLALSGYRSQIGTWQTESGHG